MTQLALASFASVLLSDADFNTAVSSCLCPLNAATEVASFLLQFMSNSLALGLPVQAFQLTRQIQQLIGC
jgi:hypothetical protein